MVADPSRDRRGYAAEFKIELSLTDRGVSVIQRGHRCLHLLDALLVGARRQRVVLPQCGPSRDIARGIFELCCRGVPLRFGLLQRNFVGTRIDDKQEIALVDDLPVLEVQFGQEAADTSTDFDIVLRSELTGIFKPLRNVPLERLADGDRWRLGVCGSAPHEGQNEASDEPRIGVHGR